MRDVWKYGLNAQVKRFEDLGIWLWEELAGASQDWYLSRDWGVQFGFLVHLCIRVLSLLGQQKPFVIAFSAQAQALHGSRHLGEGGLEGRGYT